MISIKPTAGNDPDFILLCNKLDEQLDEMVGGRENRIEYVQYNSLEDIQDAFIAYDNATPVGCMGLRKYSDNTAELKRVFVINEYRGQGISRQLMDRLELTAKTRGFTSLILETGEELTAAVELYRKSGYEVIPNYPPYENMKESVCMMKNL